MTDLKVEFDELVDSQNSLKTIMDEFNNATDRVDADESIWANDDVKDAMHTFATNWNDHRNDLLKEMNDAYTGCGKCVQYWESTDSELAKDLTTNKK